MAVPKEANRDKRGHYRKKVALFGGYIKTDTDHMGDMLVEDLSFNGLSLVTMGAHSLREGDKLRLKFRLDDENLTEIVKTGVVKYVQDRKVGVEFLSPASLDKDLSFYLLI